MKCRLFLDFLLVILLGHRKEVTLYTISKGILFSASKDALRFLFPILLNYHSKQISFFQTIHPLNKDNSAIRIGGHETFLIPFGIYFNILPIL